jgi:hypothetical protein
MVNIYSPRRGDVFEEMRLLEFVSAPKEPRVTVRGFTGDPFRVWNNEYVKCYKLDAPSERLLRWLIFTSPEGATCL